MNPDEEALKKRITDMYPSLYSQALVFTDYNEEEAKDLTQETIFKMLNRVETYITDDNLEGWGYVVMRRIFLSGIRKYKQFEEYEQNYNYNDPGNNVSYIGNPDKDQVVNEINKIINSIPKKYREPFKLVHAGYSYKEIAERLGVKLETIKNRIRKARNLVIKILRKNKFIIFLLSLLDMWL